MPLLDTPSLNDVSDPRQLVRYLANVQKDLAQAYTDIASLRTALAKATSTLDYSAIRSQLQSTGSYPLSVEQLQGHLAEAQPAALVTLASATSPAATQYDLGALGQLTTGGVTTLYEVTPNGAGVHTWTPLAVGTASTTFTSTVTFSPASGAAINITAGQLNSASQFAASVYYTAPQSIPSASLTPLNFTAEELDRGGIHDNATNNSRLTIPTGGAGIWMFVGQIRYTFSATGSRGAFIRINGGTRIAGTQIQACTAGDVTIVTVSKFYTMADGDYAELLALQTSGVAVNAEPNADFTVFQACKLC